MFRWTVLLLMAMLLAAAPTDLSGIWRVVYDGPPRTGPKTVGSMILDLKIEGSAVTGTARIGVWPGEAPIADGRIDGNHITFSATGRLSSTTGIPTCKFDITVQGEEMLVTLTTIQNGGGPLPLGESFPYKGKRKE